MQLVGNIYGTIEGLLDVETNPDIDNVSGLSPMGRVLDRAMDNPITRLGRDIEHSGSSYAVNGLLNMIGLSDSADEKIQAMKDTATKYNPNGIGSDAIVTTSDQDALYFSSATPWQALQSGGFTTLSMLVGAGEVKVASSLFGGLMKGANYLNKTGRIIKTAEGLKATTEALKKA